MATLAGEKGTKGDASASERSRPVEFAGTEDEGLNVVSLGQRFFSRVLSGKEPLLDRVRSSACDAAPRLRQASVNSAQQLAAWTRRGSSIRALFVISLGTITLLALTGLLVFMLFLAVATVSAIIVSLLMSLAAAGGFLALFFTMLTAVYIGAVSVAFFAISATTISTIVAVIVATGWVGFFSVIWLVAGKSINLTKKSIGMTSSAISSYANARSERQSSVSSKVAD